MATHERSRGTMSTGRTLEDLARTFVLPAESPLWTSDPESMFRRELALILDHLDDTRATREYVQKDLLDQECFIRTELHGVEARTPRYSPYRFPERQKLQRQLHQLASERRRTIWELDKQEQITQRELLEVLEKQLQLHDVDEA